MGGTIPGIKEKTHGPATLTNPNSFVWTDGKAARVEIPWTTIEEIEYGQKVGRRWRSAILLSPIALFSKARKHYLTITYKDAEGSGQAVVFEFDKNDIRHVIGVFKVKSGKEITYQDDEARKKLGGGAEEKKQ